MPLAYTTGTATPRARIPALACDCHLHVYDSRYPAVAGAALLPPDASVAQYRALQQRLGTRRAVLVTPSTYGNDNRPMLAALQRMGDDTRGVAVIDGSESDAQLAALHAAGVRGIRLNLSLGVTNTLDDAERLAERIAPLGWHVQLLMPPDLLARAGERLARLPAPERALFGTGQLPGLVKAPAPTLPEPHASWVEPLEKAWAQRHGA